MQLAYPFILKKMGDEYVVNFPDLPEALTGADNKADAGVFARDAMIAALGFYIEQKEAIPKPSARKPRQYMAYLRPLEAAKLALYIAMHKEHVSNVELSRRLGVDEKTVRRMLDLDQATKIDTIYSALREVFHYRLVTHMERVA